MSSFLLTAASTDESIVVSVDESTVYRKVPASTAPATRRYHRFPVLACIDPEAQRSADEASRALNQMLIQPAFQEITTELFEQ
ncbi:hypothetical protein SAMN04489860_2577 [Paraoerskovia marina]|uniref:Uncharacterized protein n=1 Tax=Paraoerskovia marina TaxID=545619 RepID=A0A1H1VQ92_9CELL|nr:hypothetical protein [Paraoerskovia marina]SDS86922.1 hypothetical protein SAMN04489860_2577 [Paraoerskovia marina]